MNNNLITNLVTVKKKLMRVVLGVNRNDALDYAIQHSYIESFDEPNGYFQRSYDQYLCQKKRHPNVLYQVILALTNAVAVVPLFYFCVLKRSSNNHSVKARSPNVAAFLGSESVMDRIPQGVRDEFREIICDGNVGLEVSNVEKKFIRKLWVKYPFSFLFVLKCSMKIAAYCSLINQKNVDAIIVTSEDSFTSSVLTEYCHCRNVRHINVMHGEIVYNLARTFFAFDDCYVWDKHYVDLLVDLRAEPSQFIVELPPGLIYRGQYEVTTKVKYYLQTQDRMQMQLIKEILDSLSCDYKVRPHSVWTDVNAMNEVFPPCCVEDPKAVSIKESIMGSCILIAWNSTVLFQGHINGKMPIIDDITNPQLFRQMQEARYVMLEKADFQVLSKFLEVQNSFPAEEIGR